MVAIQDVLTMMESVNEKDARHYGKKGMKWGVRNDPKAAGTKMTRSEKKSEKKDDKWEKSIFTMKGAIAVHNKMADLADPMYAKLNENPKYKDFDFYDKTNAKLDSEYWDDVVKIQNDAYAQAVKSVHGSSPSGNRTASYFPGNDNRPAEIIIRRTDGRVRHADGEDGEILSRVLVILDDKGHLSSTKPSKETELKHSADVLKSLGVDDADLLQYGKKGMKWGVRNDTRPTAGAKGSEVKVKVTPGKKVKTSGGKKQEIHEDAIKAATKRQVAKKSSTDALSNKELKELTERMQLEANFNRLNAQNASVGQKFIASMLGDKKARTEVVDTASKIGDLVKNKK